MTFERPYTPVPYADSLEPSFSPMPEEGNALSDLFGGPTPWQMELRDWAYAGQAQPRRMFPDAGRFDVSDALPLAPSTPMRRFDELPSNKPPPQPGTMETLMRGVGMFFSSFAGEEISNGVGNALGNVGSIFDFPFKQVGPVPFLPGGEMFGSPEEIYRKLPETELKKAYDQAIFSDPTNAALHIADYLEMHKNDIASMLGVARTTGMMFKPADSLAAQLNNLLFGAMFAAGDAVARTYVGSDVRDVQNTVLNADMESLPDELKHIRGRFEAGDITYDQMLDDITTSRWRWHQDDSFGGALLSFGLDMLTDPLVLATFGVGAAKAIGNGALRAAYTATAKAVADKGLRGAAELAIKNSGREITAQRIYDWAMVNAPDAVETGMKGLSRKQRALAKAEPIISPVYETLDIIQNPFRWMGVGKVKEAVSSGLAHGHARGYAQRIGAFNIASAKGLFSSDKEFFRLLGIHIFNNVSVPVYVKSMVNRLKNADESYRSVQGLKPVDEVRTLLNMDDGHIRAGMSATDSYMERRLPKTATGAAALEAKDAAFLNELVQDLSRISGSDPVKVRKWLGTNYQRWSLAHGLIFAADGASFSQARRTASAGIRNKIGARQAAGQPVDKLQKQLETNERLTLVSEQNMTHQRAKALMKAINKEQDQAKKAAMMREAIERYDQLDQFADQLWDDATLIKEFTTFVDELIKLKRLVKEAPDRIVDPGVKASLGSSRYILGFVPDDPWGIITDDAGRTVGADIFVDFVDDIDPERYVTKFGLRDRGVMVSFLRGIHGSLHYMKARDRFIRTSVRDLGLTAKQARDVFEVVQREGIKQGHGPRSMTNEAAYALAREALEKVDAVAAAKLEARGLIEAMVRSWEGELMDVGITSKISGRMKSAFVARTNNLVGRTAESLYPNMRFMMNPQFLGMELAEGPFFGLLRGVRLGIRRTADDIRLDSILDTTYDNTVRYNEQLERMQVAHADANVAAMAQRDLSRLGQRGAAKTLLEGPRLLHTRGGLFDYKRILYVRDWGRRASKAMKENYMKYAPEVWKEWEIAFGTGDPQKIFMRIAEERGMYSPNKRHILSLMDAAKPRGLGRREPIRVGDMALLHGFDSTVAFRQAARSGNYTEAQFIQRFKDVGIKNQQFIDDAWKVVAGFTEDEFMTAFKEIFPQSVGIGESIRTLPDGKVVREVRERFAWENIWATHMATARVLGLSPEEYLNRKFNDLPSLVDEAKPVPAGALTQKMRGALEVMQEAWFSKQWEIRSLDASAEAKLLSEYVPDFDELWETAHELGYKQTGNPTMTDKMFKAVVRAINPEDPDLGHLPGLKNYDLEEVHSYLRWVANGDVWDRNGGRLPGNLDPRTARLLGDKLAGLDAVMAQRYAKRMATENMEMGDAVRTFSVEPNITGTSVEALLGYGDAGVMRLGEALQRAAQKAFRGIADENGGPVGATHYDSGRGLATWLPEGATADDVQELALRLAAATDGPVSIHTPIILADDVINEGQAVRGYDLNVPTSIMSRREYTYLLEKYLRSLGLENHDIIASKDGLRIIWKGTGTADDLAASLPADVMAKLEDGSWVDEVDQSAPAWYADLAKVLQQDVAGREGIDRVHKEVAQFDGFAELERLRHIIWKWAGGGGDVETPRGAFERNLAGVEWMPEVIAMADIIDNAPAVDRRLLRGVRIGADVDSFLEDYPVGGTIDFNFASWTSDPDIALQFAGYEGGGRGWAVLFHLDGESKGIFRAGLSGITSREREFITQGRFRVKNVYKDVNEGRVEIFLEQEATFGSRRMDPVAIRPTAAAFDQEIVESPLKLKPTKTAPDTELIPPGALAAVPAGNVVSEAKIAELTKDMRERGYVGDDPIQLTYRQADSTIIVDEGNHRLVAAQRAGIEEVPVKVVRHVNTDSRKGMPVKSIANEDGYVPGTFPPSAIMDFLKPRPKEPTRLPLFMHGRPQYDQLVAARDWFHGALDHETTGRNISNELKDYLQRNHNAPQGTGKHFFQLDPQGRVRAYVELDADNRAGLRVVEGRADATTAIHEAAHIFARDLDPSAQSVVIGEYNKATGGHATSWTRGVEEWFADEYIAFAARDHGPTSRTGAIFRGFNEWARANGIGDKGSVLNKFFEDVFEGDYADIPKAFWDADAQRVWDVSRTVLLREEEAVHKTSYYSRNRNIIERSLNHPYLGLYPASYMWGKVLPELIHFLVKEPFGLKAPMGGAMLVGHVWRNVQWQLQVSEEMREFIDENPAFINLLQMTVPGTPWELPAVTPVVMRRAQERALENEVRKLQGKEPLKAMPLDWTSDMMTYAFGLTQMARRINDIGSELSEYARGKDQPAVPTYPWMNDGAAPLTPSLIEWERRREA